MSKYQSYKSSNIDWMGEIPSEWKIKRLKQNTYLKGRIGWQNLRADEFVDEGPYCITGTDFKDGIINWKTSYRVTEERYEIDHNIHLEEGDLIITKDGTIGKVARVENMPYKATLNSGIMLIRPTTASFHTHFLYWILNSEVFFQYNEYTKSGSTILHLYQNVFERMPFPVPTIYEQTAIANYLDEKTSKLDQLISNKKAQIEKLKEIRQIEINTAVTKGLDRNVTLKPSGIEWLGDIPEHWEVKRLKDMTHRIGDGIHSTPNYVDDSNYFFVNGNNLINKTITTNESTNCVSEEEFKSYDLNLAHRTLLLSINGTIGNLAFYKGESVVFGKSIAYMQCFDSYDEVYIHYFLQSSFVQTIFELSYAGTTIKNLSLNTIRNTKVAFPKNIEEQTAIANYLDEKTSKLDQLVSNLENQVEQLEEVRKIEIYNAVTGKIKVA